MGCHACIYATKILLVGAWRELPAPLHRETVRSAILRLLPFVDQVLGRADCKLLANSWFAAMSVSWQETDKPSVVKTDAGACAGIAADGDAAELWQPTEV